jgi:hypothetical protein
LNTSGKGDANGYTSDGSASGTGSAEGVTTTGRGVKRSRSNSSTQKLNTSGNALTPSTQNVDRNNQQLLSQLNITLNCHYCWAQFQLNVTKNLKSGSGANQLQQKENGKYMQHLALHLNAPYKCNECSYPITDTKTFFKHKQFYKHDEKTCIMVDNDVQTSTPASGTTGPVKRKALIATRLKQQILEKEKNPSTETSTTTGSENEALDAGLVHDRDTFKCSLCYDSSEQLTSPGCHQRSHPTISSHGASNYSFDKEQVLKHVLIVHLSFLAYKCDQCVQFYAFDEPQTKQHAALVHNCGLGEQGATSNNPCHFKLIKTEEEINLAINRAQQFINKTPANAVSSAPTKRETRPSNKNPSSLSLANITLEAAPKYRCCKCISSTDTKGEDGTSTSSNVNKEPIVLYSYQDALDHVMSAHMPSASSTVTASSPNGGSKKENSLVAPNKKISFELELFEQNLEDLVQHETGVVSTISHAQYLKQQMKQETGNQSHAPDEESDASGDEDGGELCDESSYYYYNSEPTEWHFLFSEPVNTIKSSSPAATASNNVEQSPTASQPQKRSKRLRSSTTSSSAGHTDSESKEVAAAVPVTPVSTHFVDFSRLKKFYFRPYLIYKCTICSRKMNTFSVEHWLQHDRENHHALYEPQTRNTEGAESAPARKQFVQHQLTVNKNVALANAQASVTSVPTSIQTTHAFKSFTHFIEKHRAAPQTSVSAGGDERLINCLICGGEVRFTYTDLAKHYQSEHEFNIFDAHLSLALGDLEVLQQLHANGMLQMCRGVHLKRRACIPATLTTSKVDLIDRELRMLNTIYHDQIVEKTIVSWLNSEQFYRRSYNYNAHVCIVCNATKLSILDAHYTQSVAQKSQLKKNLTAQDASSTTPHKQQFFSDEMRTVVLTNHVLSHFNEYCYRCMSCKISWPDRTQLLKHAQECSNSQVVRTKTKYKLKANCRLQLKFNLQSYMEYWLHERYLETQELTDGNSSTNEALVETKGDMKVYLKDVFKSKQLLLDLASKYSLSAICTDVDKRLLLSDEAEDSREMLADTQTVSNSESAVIGNEIHIEEENAPPVVAQQEQSNLLAAERTLEVGKDVEMKENDE